ncbi:hypothetical protein PCH_Pc16g06880 [Penicillium rubens Wisconsin 54-1255]|uniref:Uncharacterized protein n=1 Tax=Penicillium rubens (strain ATCC 28089 / DSM 1075 / NRRL 1951 / Wisconsin 54-1255) TaxID=500485 RepID=B6H7G1_PENRW|nr:hypothetical protein PCH_Pc16g06880 [Penicillium rubens Wisconsin 54-1255]
MPERIWGDKWDCYRSNQFDQSDPDRAGPWHMLDVVQVNLGYLQGLTQLWGVIWRDYIICEICARWSRGPIRPLRFQCWKGPARARDQAICLRIRYNGTLDATGCEHAVLAEGSVHIETRTPRSQPGQSRSPAVAQPKVITELGAHNPWMGPRAGAIISSTPINLGRYPKSPPGLRHYGLGWLLYGLSG